MGWFSNFEFNTLEDLLVIELQDLYDAELRLVDALPAAIDGANAEELKEAIATHLEETRGHVTRLEQIFQQLSVEPRRITCEAMKGLLAEAREVLESTGDPAVRDAAIIAAAQRIEHYEIAGYGAVRSWAAQMGMTGIAQLLQTTLDEEGEADKILSTIAEHSVNIHAHST